MLFFLYFRVPLTTFLSADVSKETKSSRACVSPALCDAFSTRFIALTNRKCGLGQQQKFSNLSIERKTPYWALWTSEQSLFAAPQKEALYKENILQKCHANAKRDHETDGSRLLLELARPSLTRKHFSEGWSVSLNIPVFLGPGCFDVAGYRKVSWCSLQSSSSSGLCPILGCASHLGPPSCGKTVTLLSTPITAAERLWQVRSPH